MDKYDSFIGKVLDGRYKILEVLGVGGMAFVLKAEDLMMNRVVAIKILNDQYNGDDRPKHVLSTSPRPSRCFLIRISSACMMSLSTPI